ncbi:MAG TPA: acyl-CoA dehydrogenase family protein [Novosphingobium sp.]|nr:acyl-CoA dehydrogenase family protein [Novosphingobium sp.]
MTIEYLGMRKQFDRPLAMFQALKHRCADLKTRIVAAEALLWNRANAADATATDLGALKSHAAQVYQLVTEEAIQLHGGIGLTEEYQIHLFMKRALLNAQLCGGTEHWQEKAGRQALAAA